ncbi:biotin/lipoyl-containing protein, partial [Labrys sp. (in: a-proteobacteria)]|uniref:biotin/lipoyl-containing protein n=1 Tax=Labrys sp. (in: a-proteobacteria) TaxID=1917972 RepID=UPI0039E6941C
MPVNVLMPALSPTMEKGNLAKWLKKEGDTIKSGDVLAEIETDKATMEVEAVDEGVLAKIVVPEGTADVPVNELIAVIAGEGEDAKAVAAAGGAPAPKATAQAPAAEASAAPVPAASSAPAPAAAPASAPVTAPAQAGARIFASPLAKRLAKEAGLDLGAIQGSGPHGRIVEKDVKAAIAGGGAKA